jgi:WD40 repeat protein
VAIVQIAAPVTPTAVLDGQQSGGPLLAAAPSRGLFVSAGSDRTVRLWRMQGPSLVRTYGHRSSDITAIGLSPDGTHVAAAGARGTVRIWRNTSRRGIRSRAVRTLAAHEGRVTAIALGPRGVLATGGEDGSVKLWNLRSPQTMRLLIERIAPVQALSFSRDGHRLLAAGQDGVIRVWSLAQPPTVGAI